MVFRSAVLEGSWFGEVVCEGVIREGQAEKGEDRWGQECKEMANEWQWGGKVWGFGLSRLQASTLLWHIEVYTPVHMRDDRCTEAQRLLRYCSAERSQCCIPSTLTECHSLAN